MESKIKLSLSIVLYNHSYQIISGLVENVLQIPAQIKLFIIDNSESDKISNHIQDSRIEYIFNNKNLGYGKAHNKALAIAVSEFDYHLVLNPDIEFEPIVITRMLEYLEKNLNIGLLMPKVLYEDKQIQYLCKMLPTPFDLIMRRFIPGFLKSIFENRLQQYELKHKNYDQVMEVPNLSGCFMLMRCSALKSVGFFDERFFMYLEDTDLSRRINEYYKTIYYPEVSIIHHFEKGSYKSFKLLKYHILSAFKYFGKYGWYFDTVRDTINSTMKGETIK
jgi:GT2 family glycosyltransferase